MGLSAFIPLPGCCSVAAPAPTLPVGVWSEFLENKQQLYFGFLHPAQLRKLGIAQVSQGDRGGGYRSFGARVGMLSEGEGHGEHMACGSLKTRASWATDRAHVDRDCDATVYLFLGSHSRAPYAGLLSGHCLPHLTTWRPKSKPRRHRLAPPETTKGLPGPPSSGCCWPCWRLWCAEALPPCVQIAHFYKDTSQLD